MSSKPSRTPAERLLLFVQRVDQAVNRRAIAEKTLRAHLSMSAGANGSIFTADTGDEEDLRSLLLDFRSFLAPGEPVHVHAIFNLIEQQTRSFENKDANRHNRQQWDIARRGQMGLKINDRLVTAEDCFDLYVNGELFHQDQQKAAFIASLDPFMQGVLRHQMVSFMMDGLGGPLWGTRNVAASVLAEMKGAKDANPDPDVS